MSTVSSAFIWHIMLRSMDCPENFIWILFTAPRERNLSGFEFLGSLSSITAFLHKATEGTFQWLRQRLRHGTGMIPAASCWEQAFTDEVCCSDSLVATGKLCLIDRLSIVFYVVYILTTLGDSNRKCLYCIYLVEFLVAKFILEYGEKVPYLFPSKRAVSCYCVPWLLNVTIRVSIFSWLGSNPGCLLSSLRALSTIMNYHNISQ